jgi:predicted Fe-Mo cluster-binding NifX family protein
MKKIAIPTVNRQLTLHFGHCEQFAIVKIEDNAVTDIEYVDPPVHQPGVYPAFLAGLGVNVIISGGMGQKAQSLFAANNIQVVIGIDHGNPRELAEMYLNNGLVTGNNPCHH